MMKRGYTHVYYGYGKGKTTAAIGLALRAVNYGKKVVVVQFLKNIISGEINEICQCNSITVFRGQATNEFSNAMNEEAIRRTIDIHNENLYKAILLVEESECDLLILDEVLDAYSLNFIDKSSFEKLINNKPDGLELVLTGHILDQWILDKADYVSEMVKIKHPYDSGIKARAGIEF